jgi:hypothetical protein
VKCTSSGGKWWVRPCTPEVASTPVFAMASPLSLLRRSYTSRISAAPESVLWL